MSWTFMDYIGFANLFMRSKVFNTYFLNYFGKSFNHLKNASFDHLNSISWPFPNYFNTLLLHHSVNIMQKNNKMVLLPRWIVNVMDNWPFPFYFIVRENHFYLKAGREYWLQLSLIKNSDKHTVSSIAIRFLRLIPVLWKKKLWRDWYALEVRNTLDISIPTDWIQIWLLSILIGNDTIRTYQ